MRKLLLVVVVLMAVMAADDEVYTGPSEEDVVVLDKDNLEATIYESEDTWLLELYAPWVRLILFSVDTVKLSGLSGRSSPPSSRELPRLRSWMLPSIGSSTKLTA